MVKAGGDLGNNLSLNDANSSINRKGLVKSPKRGHVPGFLLFCIFSGVGIVCWFGFSFLSPVRSLEKGRTSLRLGLWKPSSSGRGIAA